MKPGKQMVEKVEENTEIHIEICDSIIVIAILHIMKINIFL